MEPPTTEQDTMRASELERLARDLELKAEVRRFAQKQLDKASRDLHEVLFQCLDREMTQSEAARLMGVSRIRVSQIVKEYQDLLEAALEADGD